MQPSFFDYEMEYQGGKKNFHSDYKLTNSTRPSVRPRKRSPIV